MKHVMLALMFIGMMGSATAQEAGKKENRKEMIKAKRVAFITERAGLTSAEAEKFWPVFNELEERKKEIKKEGPKRKGKDLEALSESEAAQMLKDELIRKEKIVQLDQDYLPRLIGSLSAKKLMMVYKADREFKKEVLKSLKGQSVRDIKQRGLKEGK